MPPIRKFTRNDIVNIAYEIVKNEGIEQVNSRRIAKELGCSVQPIFHNFKTMEELYREVYQKIYQKYQDYMTGGTTHQNSYKQMGLGYINFAKDYPEFFKILFMKQTNLNAESFVMTDTISDEIIKAGQKLTGLSIEQQKKFHVKVWIFTHGIACLVAMKTTRFTPDEIDYLLESTVREMLKGYLLKKEDIREKCN